MTKKVCLGWWAAGSCALLGGISYTAPVCAQTSTPTLNMDLKTFGNSPNAAGVMERERPDYDPVGLPLGSFRLIPYLDVNGFFDDNVYRIASNARGDWYSQLSGQAVLQSSWSRNMLRLQAGLDRYDYATQGSETRTDWKVRADGRIDLGDMADIIGTAFYNSTHEPRNSVDQPLTAASPSAYRDTHAESTFEYKPSRFGFYAGVIFDRFDYSATELRGGGEIDNHDYDRNVVQTFARGAYEFSPGYAGFLRATYNTHTFDQSIDRNGIHRDTDGYSFDTGLDMLITDLVRGELFLGYAWQNYDAPLPNVNGVDFGTSLSWYVTTLLTLHLNSYRVFTDTILDHAATSDDKHVEFSADYELLRNVILRGLLGYIDSSYPGLSRDDRYTEVALEAKYLINHNFNLTARYEYTGRASTDAIHSYKDNQFMLGVRIQR